MIDEKRSPRQATAGRITVGPYGDCLPSVGWVNQCLGRGKLESLQAVMTFDSRHQQLSIRLGYVGMGQVKELDPTTSNYHIHAVMPLSTL